MSECSSTPACVCLLLISTPEHRELCSGDVTQNWSVQLAFDKHSSTRHGYLNRHLDKMRHCAVQVPPRRDKYTTSGLLTQTTTHAAWHKLVYTDRRMYKFPFTVHKLTNTHWYTIQITHAVDTEQNVDYRTTGDHSNHWLKNLCALFSSCFPQLTSLSNIEYDRPAQIWWLPSPKIW